MILIPEISFTYEKLADYLNTRDCEGYTSSLVVVAEGAKPAGGEQSVRSSSVPGEYRLGGMGEQVAAEIAARTGKETRCTVLGHLQRGGTPTTLDRILGTRFGVMAVKLIEEGRFGTMVSYQNYQVMGVPIAEAVHKLRVVTEAHQMVATARSVDVSFGD